MSDHLKKFKEEEIIISNIDAFNILSFYFGTPKLDAAALEMTDIAFAQALLLEGIDASESVGYVEDIFRKLYGGVPNSFSIIKGLAKAFAKRAINNWFKKATGKQLEDPKIYQIVKDTISWKWGRVWATRVQTGELIGY